MAEQYGRLKIFVASWNMGNAEQFGMRNIFDEKAAIGNYDLFVIGLQESTYTLKGQQGTDPIAHLKKQLGEIMGDGYYEVPPLAPPLL